MIRFASRALVALAVVSATVFAQRGVPIPQQLVFAPYDESGVYEVGETVGWSVTAGTTPPTYVYKWTIRRNNAVVLEEGTLDLSSGRDTIEVVAGEPSMIYVAIQAVAPLDRPAQVTASGSAPQFTGGNAGRNTGFYAVGAAVAPTKIGVSTPRPADFDTFWDARLAAQASVPINAVLTPITTEVPNVELSIFELDALGSKAHGYVAKPAREGRFPAIGRKAGYPNWPSDSPDVMKTALYFDTVNFASRIEAPVMAGMGFIDTISPPAGIWTLLNQIPGPVEALPMIESEHDNLTPAKGRACPARTNEILSELARGGTWVPTVLAQ